MSTPPSTEPANTAPGAQEILARLNAALNEQLAPDIREALISALLESLRQAS